MQCVYSQIITETQYEIIGEDSIGYPVYRPFEEAIGEYCWKKGEYSPNCEGCLECK